MDYSANFKSHSGEVSNGTSNVISTHKMSKLKEIDQVKSSSSAIKQKIEINGNFKKKPNETDRLENIVKDTHKLILNQSFIPDKEAKRTKEEQNGLSKNNCDQSKSSLSRTASPSSKSPLADSSGPKPIEILNVKREENQIKTECIVSLPSDSKISENKPSSSASNHLTSLGSSTSQVNQTFSSSSLVTNGLSTQTVSVNYLKVSTPTASTQSETVVTSSPSKQQPSSFSMDTLLQHTMVNTKIETLSADTTTSATSVQQLTTTSTLSSTLALSPSVVISKQNTPLSSVLSDEYSIESPLSVGSSGKDEPGKPIRKRDPAEERQRLRNYRLPHHKSLSRASTTAVTSSGSSVTPTSNVLVTTTSVTVVTKANYTMSSKPSTADSTVNGCVDSSKLKALAKSDNKGYKPKPMTIPFSSAQLAPLKPQPTTLLQTAPGPSGHLLNSSFFLPSGPTAFSSYPQSYPFPFLPAIFNNQYFNTPISAVNGKTVSNSAMSTASSGVPCSVPSSVAASVMGNRYYPHPPPQSQQSQLTIFTSPTSGAPGGVNSLSPFSFQNPTTLLSPTFSPTGLPGNAPGSGPPLLVPKSLNFSPNLTFPSSGATLDPHSLMMFGFPNNLQPTISKVPSSQSMTTTSTHHASPPFILPRIVNTSTSAMPIPGCSMVTSSTPSGRGSKSKICANSINNQAVSKPMPIKPSLMQPTFIFSNPANSNGTMSMQQPQHSPMSILHPQTLFLLQPPSMQTIQTASQVPQNKPPISICTSQPGPNVINSKSACKSNYSPSSAKKMTSPKAKTTSSAITLSPNLTSPTTIRTGPTLSNSFIIAPTSPHSQLPYTLFSQPQTQTLMQPISIQAPPPPPPSSLMGGQPLLLSVISPTNRTQINNLGAAQFSMTNNNNQSVVFQTSPQLTINNLPITPLPVTSKAVTKSTEESKVTSTSPGRGSKSRTTKTTTVATTVIVTSSVTAAPQIVTVSHSMPTVQSITPNKALVSIASSINPVAISMASAPINIVSDLVPTSINSSSSIQSSTKTKSFFSTLNESHFRDCSLSTNFLSSANRTLPSTSSRQVSSVYTSPPTTSSQISRVRTIKTEKGTDSLTLRPPTKLISPNAAIGLDELASLVQSVNDTIKSFGSTSDFYDVDLSSLKHKGENIHVVVVEDDAFSPERLKPLPTKESKSKGNVKENDPGKKNIKIIVKKEIKTDDSKQGRKNREDDDTSDGSKSKKKKNKKHKDKKKGKIRVTIPVVQKPKMKRKVQPRINCIRDPAVLERVQEIIQIFSTTFKVSEEEHKRVLPAPLPEMFRVKYVRKTAPDVKMSSIACGADPLPVKLPQKSTGQRKTDSQQSSTVEQSSASQSFLPLKKRQHRNVEENSETLKEAHGQKTSLSSIDSTIEAVVAAAATKMASSSSSTDRKPSRGPKKKNRKENLPSKMNENTDGVTRHDSEKSETSERVRPILSDRTKDKLALQVSTVPLPQIIKAKSAKAEGKHSLTTVANMHHESHPSLINCGSGTHTNATAGSKTVCSKAKTVLTNFPLITREQSPPTAPSKLFTHIGTNESNSLGVDLASTSANTSHHASDQICPDLSADLTERKKRRKRKRLPKALPIKREDSLSTIDSILNEVIIKYRANSPPTSDPSDADDELDVDSECDTQLPKISSFDSNKVCTALNIGIHTPSMKKDISKSLSPHSLRVASKNKSELVTRQASIDPSSKTSLTLDPTKEKVPRKRKRRFNRTGFQKPRKRVSKKFNTATANSTAHLEMSTSRDNVTNSINSNNIPQASSTESDEEELTPPNVSKIAVNKSVLTKNSKKKIKKKKKIVQASSSSECDRKTMTVSSVTDSSLSEMEEIDYDKHVFLVTEPSPGTSLVRKALKIKTNPFIRANLIKELVPGGLLSRESIDLKFGNTSKEPSSSNKTKDNNPGKEVQVSECSRNWKELVPKFHFQFDSFPKEVFKETFNYSSSSDDEKNNNFSNSHKQVKQNRKLFVDKTKCKLMEKNDKFQSEHWFQYKYNPLPNPVSSALYRRVRQNVFGDVRPIAEQERHFCDCPKPKDSEKACESGCFNRLVYVECQPGFCPYETCDNRRIQKGEWSPGLQRFLTPQRGWAIRTTETIKKGDFIMEYIGETVSDRLFHKRMHERYVSDMHHYCLSIEQGIAIDGYRIANEGRFVNHSCDPNCEIQKWAVNGYSRMCLFAVRDIQPGEELFYDYNFSNYNSTKTQQCLCGSSKCRGIIGGKRKTKKNNQIAPKASTSALNTSSSNIIKIGGPTRAKPPLNPEHPESKSFMHFKLKNKKVDVPIEKLLEARLTEFKNKIRSSIDSTVPIYYDSIQTKLRPPSWGSKTKSFVKKSCCFLIRNYERSLRLNVIIADLEPSTNKENGYSSSDFEVCTSNRRRGFTIDSSASTSDSDATSDSGSNRRTLRARRLKDQNAQILSDICCHIRASLKERIEKSFWKLETPLNDKNEPAKNGGLKRKLSQIDRKNGFLNFKPIHDQICAGKFTQYEIFKKEVLAYIKSQFTQQKGSEFVKRIKLDNQVLPVCNGEDQSDWKVFEKIAIDTFLSSAKEKEKTIIENYRIQSMKIKGQQFDQQINRLMSQIKINENNNISEENDKKIKAFSKQLVSATSVQLNDQLVFNRKAEALLLKEIESESDSDSDDKYLPRDITNNDIIRCMCGVARENVTCARDDKMVECDKCNNWQHFQCAQQFCDGDLSDPSVTYLCEACQPKVVPKEIPLDPKYYPQDLVDNEKYAYYINLESPLLKRMVSVGDCVYLRRAELGPGSSIHLGDSDDPFLKTKAKEAEIAIQTFKEPYNKDKLIIMRIERLVISKKTNQKLIYGFIYLYARESYHTKGKKFYSNELLKTFDYEWAPIEEVNGFCEVLEPATYKIGRPVGIKKEDLYIVDYQVDKSRRFFTKLRKSDHFPVDIKSFAFKLYKDRLQIIRDYIPNKDETAMEELRTCNEKMGRESEQHFLQKQKIHEKKMINLLKIANGLSQLAFYRDLVEEQTKSEKD